MRNEVKTFKIKNLRMTKVVLYVKAENEQMAIEKALAEEDYDCEIEEVTQDEDL